MKKTILLSLLLLNVFSISACGRDETSEVLQTSESIIAKKKEIKKNGSLGNHTGLKIGDTISVKYAKEFKGENDFDFTLNKIEFTDQPLAGEEPAYERGFLIADVTLKNTGNSLLSVDVITNINYGTSVFSYGSDYGFNSFDESEELNKGESKTGKIVVMYPKASGALTRGLEGTSTVFSYDIKADEIGDYVPE